MTLTCRSTACSLDHLQCRIQRWESIGWPYLGESKSSWSCAHRSEATASTQFRTRHALSPFQVVTFHLIIQMQATPKDCVMSVSQESLGFLWFVCVVCKFNNLGPIRTTYNGSSHGRLNRSYNGTGPGSEGTWGFNDFGRMLCETYISTTIDYRVLVSKVQSVPFGPAWHVIFCKQHNTSWRGRHGTSPTSYSYYPRLFGLTVERLGYHAVLIAQDMLAVQLGSILPCARWALRIVAGNCNRAWSIVWRLAWH